MIITEYTGVVVVINKQWNLKYDVHNGNIIKKAIPFILHVRYYKLNLLLEILLEYCNHNVNQNLRCIP